MSRKPAPKRGRQKAQAMTPLEQRFCHEYVVDFIAYKAIQRAGSQAKNLHIAATEMKRKPHVAAYISNLIAQQNEKAAVNKQWIMTELVLVYRTAMAAADTAKGSNPAERANALRALDKLGAHVDVNAFRQQIGLGNPDGSTLDLSGLSDEKLNLLESILSEAALSSGGASGEGETIQ